MIECKEYKCGCEGKPGWHEDKYARLHLRSEFEANLEVAMEEVKEEVLRAYKAFPVDFRSAHEGVAIIEEEFIEFRDAVYWPHKEETGDEDTEVVQLAAMSIRYLIDVCYKEDTPR